MITTAFLSILFTVIGWFINMLPSVTTNSAFGSAISTASGYISSIHSFIPYITVTIIAIIAFDLAFESIYLFYKVIMWVLKRLPTQS
jgi:hypothetical protein